MKHTKKPNSTEPDVFLSQTRAEVNNTSVMVVMVVMLAFLLIFRFFDTLAISHLSEELIDAQLNRNLIVVETEKGRLESIDKLPDSTVLDYAEQFANNFMQADVGTYKQNHAYARTKLNSSYNVSVESFFKKWEASIDQNAITQDWDRTKIEVKPAEDNARIYKFTGHYQAWAGTALYANLNTYIEVEVKRTEVTESTPLGIEIVRFDAPQMRGNK